jgi:type II restriction enzyme
MDLTFRKALGAGYTSGPQRIRNLSEDWVGQQVYCPSCGHTSVTRYCNNRPVADFFCGACRAEFELKSQARIFGNSVADGAYGTMIERLTSSSNPSLVLLHYDRELLSVVNLIVVPKHFFIPGLIVKRKPLALTARRAGWVGCRIILDGIPQAGRIFLIRNCEAELKSHVLAQWQRTLFLRDQKDMASKGWLLTVMRCIERIGKSEFTLSELYQFESELESAYPANRHIREKIRQKLQVLRDKNFLEFAGRGVYRLRA